MKYTDEQRAILSLCRKYNGVKVEFYTDWYNIIFANGREIDFHIGWRLDEVEKEISANAPLKSVGRPKGSTKPSGKVKRVLSLTKEADEQLSELAEREKSSRSAVISEIVSEKHKNLCKDCYYSGVGIYCVRNSWTEPFKEGGCEHFSKKGGE